MGLAKKGTCLIAVDAAQYRWAVSGNDGFLDLLVEKAGGGGQRLGIQMDYDVGEVTPALVRTLILSALEQDWTPGKRGKQLRFRLDGEHLLSWGEYIERKELHPGQAPTSKGCASGG